MADVPQPAAVPVAGTFPTNLRSTIVTDLITVPTEEVDVDYIFSVDFSSVSRVIAASTSKNVIKLYDPDTCGLIGQLAGHGTTISEVHFAPTLGPTTLVSSSHDSTVRVWDVRSGTQVQEYRATNQAKDRISPLTAVEAYTCSTGGPTGAVLAAGAGKEVLLWDMRVGQTGLVRYTEIHTDDVTQIRFHPTAAQFLISASMDGLASSLDITQPDLDEVLQSSMNVDESISKITTFGELGQFLAIITHGERIILCDIAQGTIITDFGAQLREHLSSWPGVTINYFIDCKYSTQNQLLLLAGNYAGEIYVFQIINEWLHPIAHLASGHKALIRDFWLERDGSVGLSGGEDSHICLWTQQPVPVNRQTRRVNGASPTGNLRFRPY